LGRKLISTSEGFSQACCKMWRERHSFEQGGISDVKEV